MELKENEPEMKTEVQEDESVKPESEKKELETDFSEAKEKIDSDYRNEIFLKTTDPKKSNLKTIILLIILIIVLSASAYLIINSKNGLKNLNSPQAQTKSEEPVPTQVPSETPKPQLNKSDWTFEVLNGSGKTGFAKLIADKVEELGYEIVKVGNAENSDFEKTQILVIPALKDSVELVIFDIKDIIKVASYGGELKGSGASARIIIGKDSI